jgi:hypothetical protein
MSYHPASHPRSGNYEHHSDSHRKQDHSVPGHDHGDHEHHHHPRG